MKIASLDLGTNSLILTVAEWNGTAFTPLFEDVQVVRLGQDLAKRGSLHPEAKKRCLKELQNFSEKIAQFEIENVLAAGTAALRNAGDGVQFVQEIEDQLGFSFRIISGDEEASLTFKAIQHEFADLAQQFIMIDIGGGSSELVVGDGDIILSKTSLEVGTVSFTERFVQHDPPAIDELNAASSVIAELMHQFPAGSTSSMAVGVAGTVTTLKAVDVEMDEYDPCAVHRSQLNKDDVVRLGKLFRSMPTKQRVKIKGLPPMRADIIPMGATILETLMKELNLESVYVSDRGLRWGLLYDWIEKNG